AIPTGPLVVVKARQTAADWRCLTEEHWIQRAAALDLRKLRFVARQTLLNALPLRLRDRTRFKNVVVVSDDLCMSLDEIVSHRRVHGGPPSIPNPQGIGALAKWVPGALPFFHARQV